MYHNYTLNRCFIYINICIIHFFIVKVCLLNHVTVKSIVNRQSAAQHV